MAEKNCIIGQCLVENHYLVGVVIIRDMSCKNKQKAKKQTQRNKQRKNPPNEATNGVAIKLDLCRHRSYPTAVGS